MLCGSHRSVRNDQINNYSLGVGLSVVPLTIREEDAIIIW